MERRALLLGIDRYDYLEPLAGCVADANQLASVLARHDDASPDYECQVLTGPGALRLARGLVLRHLERLFAYAGDVLFYFSGHGVLMEDRGYLATQDGMEHQPGIAMRDLLRMANASPAREVTLILDCCHSGSLGAPATVDAETAEDRDVAYLREGVTLLAAARASEPALEEDGRGVFTRLVADALSGGAADVRGYVSAAGVYAYVEQALGAWDQRPLYRSNASRLAPLRRCTPAVPDTALRRLPDLFPEAGGGYRLDTSYEYTHADADPAHVAIFDLFKLYRDAHLLRPVVDSDLFFAALHGTEAALTPLGRFYWYLAKVGRL